MSILKFDFLKTFALIAIVMVAGATYAAPLFENFESPSVAATNNNGVLITYPSGQWFSFGITNPRNATENDRKNGNYSIRMRGLDGRNTLEMRFDKAGAGVLSFNYASYSNHRGGEFNIQQSVNGGTVWTTIGTPVVVPKWSGTFFTYSLPVNYDGNIRFRIVMTLRSPNDANEQVNIDDLQITDFGTTQTAMPTSNITTGVYETSQNITLTSATSGANIYYTTDGSAPTAASTLYTTPIVASTTTKVRAIAVANDQITSREEVVLINIPENIDNIAAFYSKMAASDTNMQYFKYTGNAIVTASYDATYKTVFLQDNTAGILISDFNKNLANTLNIGDKVSNIIAQVNNMNDSPQLYPYQDFTVVSSANVVNPTVITLAQVPDYSYQLVQINDLTFSEADGTKKFGPNSPLKLIDATSAISAITFRTPSGMPNPDYIGEVIPENRNVIVLVARNSSAVSTHTIFARNAAELYVQTSNVSKIESTSIRIKDNFVNFDTSRPENIKVFNMSGQIIKYFVSEIGLNSFSLDKGVYIIRIGDKTAKVLL